MDTVGNHIIADLSFCNPDKINNVEEVKAFMVEAAKKAGATVREAIFHEFEPSGVSGVVVLSESHISIHTWPEAGYCSVDIYTCSNARPEAACMYLADAFESKCWQFTEIKRGIKDYGSEERYHTIRSSGHRRLPRSHALNQSHHVSST